MPRLVDYRCPDCGARVDDMFYRNVEDVSDTIQCRCGGEMRKVIQAQFYIDDWSPMTNDARRDIEHFAKKPIKNGSYQSREIYRQDKIQQSVNHLANLQEV